MRTLLLALIAAASLQAQVPDTGIVTYQLTTPGHALTLKTVNDGRLANDPVQHVAALKWLGTSYDLVYASGFYLAGLKPGGLDTLNVWDVEYSSEAQPGRILNQGRLDSLLAQDYHVNPTFFALPDHYAFWPPEAPHDLAGQPLQLSAKDSWTVFNDLNDRNTNEDPWSLSPGFGVEVQRQTFMFVEYPFDRAVLVRHRMINKSNVSYDSCYFALWHDADVAFSSTNQSGIDSSLRCLYTFNPTGTGPFDASGHVLLQMPALGATLSDTMQAVDIGSTGFFIRTRPSTRPAPLAAAIAPLKNIKEPAILEQDLTRYLYCRGLDDAGQPKAGGVFDLIWGQNSVDQRAILSTGPFVFAAGDTQDIWYAMIGATAGTSTSSVDSLLSYTEQIRRVFESDMNQVIVDLRDLEPNTPGSFRLFSNYPNPFNPTTTIKYVLPKTAKVSLKIYNILGQEVRTLVNTRQSFGEHSVVWDGKNAFGRSVSSGVYLYRLSVDGHTKVKKMMVIK